MDRFKIIRDSEKYVDRYNHLLVIVYLPKYIESLAIPYLSPLRLLNPST
jgi:hypothetical protein